MSSEPTLIRNDTPHQVSMPEGTNVAAGKKANASEPSVRKVLAGPDVSVNESEVDEHRVIAPEAAAVKSLDEQISFAGHLKEENVQAPESEATKAADEKTSFAGHLKVNNALAPEADAMRSVEEQPSFDRQLKQGNALAPTAADNAQGTEAATEQRTENDQMALMPEASPDKSEVAFAPKDTPATRDDQGPLINHSEKDQFVVLPEAIPVPVPDDGPLIKRSEQDRFVALPDPVSETMASYNMPLPDEDSEEPVFVQPVEAGAEALEFSDAIAVMMQMDFPARVVKLKIENDKVRTKLDALQGSARR